MKKRPISISVPKGILKMTLWAGTEDEESFPIKCLWRGTPHIIAYGVRYDLTEEEVMTARQLVDLLH